MTKLLKFSEKLYPLHTAKSFEEYTSILLDAVEDIELNTAAAPAAGTILFAKAQGTWTRAAGHGSSVSCLACNDPIGTTTSGSAFNVYLPRANLAKDPNVYVNDILQYVEVGGVKYATGTGYLDAPIGTIVPFYLATIRHGWELCDGGGSVPDLREFFIYGAVDDTEIGDTGGSEDHVHDILFTQLPVKEDASFPSRDVVSADGFGCTGGPKEADCITPKTSLPPYVKALWIIRVGPSGEVT